MKKSTRDGAIIALVIVTIAIAGPVLGYAVAGKFGMGVVLAGLERQGKIEVVK